MFVIPLVMYFSVWFAYAGRPKEQFYSHAMRSGLMALAAVYLFLMDPQNDVRPWFRWCEAASVLLFGSGFVVGATLHFQEAHRISMRMGAKRTSRKRLHASPR